MVISLHQDEIHLSRLDVRFPVEIRIPAGFEPSVPDTWPTVEGRLEYIDGKLLYMPPCGDTRGSVVADVVYQLKHWARGRPDFVVRTNEAGMLLGNDVRGAVVAVWRRTDVPSPTGGFHRTPPLLAVEVAGQDDGEPELEPRVRWYLEHAVAVVWLVLPRTGEVVVVTPEGRRRETGTSRLPEHPALPGLAPSVADLFTEL